MGAQESQFDLCPDNFRETRILVQPEEAVSLAGHVG